MKLIQSSVIYNREAHTYTLDGVRLSGVTSLIKYQLQPDSYNGIPDSVLAKAAEKGSLVHDLCEEFDNFGIIQTEEDVQRYEKQLTEQGLPYSEIFEKCAMLRNAIQMVEVYSALTKEHQYLLSEYVVTDGKDFASPIDKVFFVDEHTVDIADIKTISSLDDAAIEKVQWQTSIYAEWLESMNPDVKVRNLYVIWLPDRKYWTKSKQPCIKSLERIPSEEVKRLLACEVSDEKYRDNSVRRSERDGYTAVVKADDGVPAEISALKGYVTSTLSLFKKADAEKKEMVEKVKEAMAAFNIKSWSTDEFSFVQSADSTTRTLDIEALKADHPEIDFEKYYKTTKRKGGFTAKLK